MTKTLSKQKIFKIAILVLSVLFLASAVTAVSFGIKYNESQKASAKQYKEFSEKLSEQISANESLSEENSSQAESYKSEIEKQSSEHESVVNDLNKKIKDLNKQLAAKKNNEANNTKLPKPTSSKGKTVYLTFDDGPSSYTPQILDTLDKYGVKATFFVKNGGKYNYLMKEIVNRGNAIGIHTYSHDYKAIYSSEEAYYNDMNKILKLVKDQTGVDTKIMRFPGGSSNTVSKNYSKGIMTRLSKSVVSNGFVYYDWNCSNGDADGANTTQKQLNYCSQYPKSASRVIVLMHDTKQATRDSLPKIIEYYKSCGFEFAVLTESVPPVHHGINN